MSKIIKHRYSDINYENLYLYEIENLYILSHIVHKELDK